ncbi:MAG: hypothetical protein GY757_61540, partial [bacterium]|nr:hypothetical protein [bacterium]
FKYTGQKEIIVASPVYTAENREFNKYIPLRDRVEPHMTFKELLMKIKETVVEGYKKEYYPIKNLVDYLDITEESDMYRIALVLENIHRQGTAAAGNDIQFQINKTDGGPVTSCVTYDASKFKPETIRQLLNSYARVLTRVLNNTKIGIGEIELLSPEEKNAVLYQLNETGKEYPGPKTIHRLFQQQAVKTPDNIALHANLDISDPADELKTPSLSSKTKHYCFKKNPYIFESPLQLKRTGTTLYILKTHRHSSVVVNENVLKMLTLFDGQKSIKRIFEGIRYHAFKLFLYPVNADDLLEISSSFGKQEKYTLEGDLENLSEAVSALYRHNLLDLKEIDAQSLPLKEIEAGYFETVSPEDTTSQETLAGEILDLESGAKKAQVLLLGDTPGMPSTGLLYLASYLKRNGIKAMCRFYDPDRDKTKLRESIHRLLDKIEPGIVAVSLKWFLHISRVQEICKIIKEYKPGIKVVLGGNTASYYWEELIADDNIDYIIRGDGEEPLLQICKHT